MPIKHQVEEDGRLLRLRRWGEISIQDEEMAGAQRAHDPLIVPGIAVLADCREVEPADTTEMVRSMAESTTRIAAALQCGPLAILVASDVEFGMARMFMAYTELEHPRTEVFRSETAALAWLEQESSGCRATAPSPAIQKRGTLS